MINEIIMEAVQKEVESRVSGIVNENEYLKSKNKDLQESTLMLKDKLKQVNTQLLNKQLIDTFTSKINVNNIEEVIISNLGFKYEDIKFDGMNSDQIPEWFKILANYNSHKEDILQIFKLFNIEHPQWAVNVTIPTYYSKEQLMLCLNNPYQLYVCNGAIYEWNMGFYYQEHVGKRFDLEEVFKKSSYVQIPFQLLLKNKLLVEDEELFNKMCKLINDATLHSEYFLKITDYQDIEINEVLKFIKINDKNVKLFSHIFKKHPQLLSVDDIGKLFKNKISDNRYNDYYVLNFNKDIQEEFFLSYEGRIHNYVQLISESDKFTDDEKAELVKKCYLRTLQ